jgi:DGQHR domain-containing protein
MNSPHTEASMAMQKPKKAKAASHENGDSSYTYPVMELQQGVVKMYAFVAPSTVLRRVCSVSRREEDAEKGFQRHLKEARLRQIARYVDDKHGVIPNNIILDFYHEAVEVNEVKSTITFPGTTKCAWVIDGQHRLFGFEYAKTVYPLLVVAFIRPNLEQDVNMFVTINNEQKRLPSSLTLDLLGIIGTEEDINTRCRDLVAKLNEDEESPWYDLVNMTGESVGYISLVNFVRKVKPFVSQSGVLKSFTFLEQYGSLANYWSAIKAVYADQWGRSLLTKTVGFGAMMNLFPTVFTKTLAMKGEFTTTAVISTLSLMKDIKFDSETLGSGTGNKAEMAACEVLVSKLGAEQNAAPGNKAEMAACEVLADELEQAISSTVPAGAPGVLKL